MNPARKLELVFYRSARGAEPVRERLFEVRTGLPDGTIARVPFCFQDGLIYALHGFIMKRRRPPGR